ncbi:MAG: hypothetical protein P4L41_01825 [Flavipsychrobacter sp.]|nr:hypothetical protein [Flavipsychrobacter sp.]
MKKATYAILLTIAGTILMTSCKKDYHCACTYNGIAIYNKDLGNQSKRDAKNQCNENTNTVPGETWNCDVY